MNGCNNDIVLSVSDDAGASFTGTTTPVWELPSVNDEGRRLADQWWQWAAHNPKTGKVTVAYYDRKYGDAMATGAFDITMRRGNGDHVRVTNRTLPPTQEFPEAGASTGVFLGDYMGGPSGRRGRPPGLDRHPQPDLLAQHRRRHPRAGPGPPGHRHLHQSTSRVVGERSILAYYARSVSLVQYVTKCREPRRVPGATRQRRLWPHGQRKGATVEIRVRGSGRGCGFCCCSSPVCSSRHRPGHGPERGTGRAGGDQGIQAQVHRPGRLPPRRPWRRGQAGDRGQGRRRERWTAPSAARPPPGAGSR